MEKTAIINKSCILYDCKIVENFAFCRKSSFFKRLKIVQRVLQEVRNKNLCDHVQRVGMVFQRVELFEIYSNAFFV